MIDSVASGPGPDRLGYVLQLAGELGGDAALLTHLPDIRWSCGFTGSNGIVLISDRGASFHTDSRYTTQAAQEVSGAEIAIVTGSLIASLAGAAPNRLIYQSDRVTVNQAESLSKAFPEAELIAATEFLSEARGRKTLLEIGHIERALQISESVLNQIPDLLRPGLSERELASEIDYLQRKLGADGPAFDTIVAFGENAAKPHARPGDRQLKKGDCVLVDTGCHLNGYLSDITRNYFYGVPDTAYLKAYDVVRSAQESAIAAAKAGVRASDLDSAARSIISSEGYGSSFSHSLGHGVGLEIHEWPRIAATSDSILPAGAVVTVEPGIYMADQFGIRIEDLILLENDGCRRLNKLSTDLTIIGA